MASIDVSTVSIPFYGEYSDADPTKQQENLAYINEQIWNKMKQAGFVLTDNQMDQTEKDAFQTLWDTQTTLIDKQSSYLDVIKEFFSKDEGEETEEEKLCEQLKTENEGLKEIPFSKENYRIRSQIITQHDITIGTLLGQMNSDTLKRMEAHENIINLDGVDIWTESGVINWDPPE